MNLPNRLTLSRLLLTVAFMWAMFWEFPFNRTIALGIFVIASLTDWLDGWIARRRRQITNFGILADPLADKILTCSAFISFVELGHMDAWMVVVIVARELAITGLRLLGASKNVVLAAEGYGKHKTISQITAIIAVLTLRSYGQWGFVGQAVFGWTMFGASWTFWFTELAIYVTLGLTFISGALYLRRNRELYLGDL